jgi:CheY-like chemotaxis protein
LVFTDHRMPGSMTGAQLATRIRREFPSVVVIVTSAYFDDQGWSEPVVVKPYNLFEIATALAQRARDRQQREGDL